MSTGKDTRYFDVSTTFRADCGDQYGPITKAQHDASIRAYTADYAHTSPYFWIALTLYAGRS